MSNHPSSPHPTPGTRPQRGAALPWVFFGFLAVAGFFFFTEHRAHLMGALPFILLALCPFMHFFHGGHGGHGGSGNSHGSHGPTGTDAGAAGGDAPREKPASAAAAPPTAPPPPHRH